MINDGPKNEIYLEPGQTLAVRLTASDYGKVAVGMRSLNGGTVNYRLNGTDGSVSSSVDLYYETKPQNGMLVITNTGSSVMALTKIRVTGLASGTSLASSFSVDTDTVVYALQCIAGEPEVTSENRFPDVPETEWYRDAVVWADAAGVATGYANGNFGPCDEITREQLAVMLYRYAQKNGMDVTAAENLSRYEDADQVSAFARTAMEWAVAEGIISGKYDQTQLDPQGSATRAECAAVIMRYMEKLEQQA